ncbi:MAG: hypothetical protein ACJA2N_001397 [Salibacteraceae bacterium]|jgi:hypothetical protein
MCLSVGIGSAQNVKIKGVVSDSLTGEPIPFANVVFQGKNIGTTTGIDGKYILESSWGSNYLIFSSLGYGKKVVKLPAGSSVEVNMRLASTSQELKAFEVRTKKHRYRNKENPAVVLIRNVLAHRDENRGKTFEYFEFEKYVKRQYDLNNFTDKIFENKGMEGFQVLREYVDTSALNGKPFLPVMIQEKISGVYQRNYGKDEKEIVTATKLSGFDNGNISSGVDQFMSKIGGDVDIYESKIVLFDKSFTSPISPIGPTIYRYYILDSMLVNGMQFKKLAFMPRNKTMVAFTGFMWVGDSLNNYAVQSIELNIDDKMNINFVEDMRITQEFIKTDEIGWHIEKEIMIVDFQLVGKATGVFSTKTTSYSKYKINDQRTEDFYKHGGVSYDVEEEELPEEYWVSHRHDTLTQAELGVYDLADTIQNIKQFQALNLVIRMLGSAYLGVKKIEIGPLTSIASHNTVEGWRVRTGFRTNLKFSKYWRFSAWGAYGFKDEKFKYAAKVEYFFDKNPFRKLSVSYVDNIYQPGFAIRNIPQDHYILSSFRTNLNMFYEKKFDVSYEHEWYNGLSNTFSARHRELRSTRFNPMRYQVSENVKDVLTDNSVSIGTRFSINERFLQGEFVRSPIKTAAPVFKMKYTYSGPGLGSDYEYHKLFVRIEKRFMPGILGFTDIEIEGNKLFGKVAYPLLINHRGNQTFTYDKTVFNSMSYMEFASDQSAAVFMEHHFNGLLFSFIPVLKNTKVRSVISARALVGNVSIQNKNTNDSELLDFPFKINENGQTAQALHELSNGPYVEAGVGVENIFNIFRFDLVKRFTYLGEEYDPREFAGVKGLSLLMSLKLKF